MRNWLGVVSSPQINGLLIIPMGCTSFKPPLKRLMGLEEDPASQIGKVKVSVQKLSLLNFRSISLPTFNLTISQTLPPGASWHHGAGFFEGERLQIRERPARSRLPVLERGVELHEVLKSRWKLRSKDRISGLYPQYTPFIRTNYRNLTRPISPKGG